MPHDYFTIGAKIVAAVAALTGLAYVAWICYRTQTEINTLEASANAPKPIDPFNL